MGEYALMITAGGSQYPAKTPGEMEGETTFMCVKSRLPFKLWVLANCA